MTEEEMKLYIDKCKLFVQFMCVQQWTGLSNESIAKWLNNFNEYSLYEKYLAHKLLVNIIYFSESDVIDTLKNGIFKCLYHDLILKKQIESDFGLSQQKISNIINTKLSESCFTPLLDSDSPHESGNYISRLLVQHGIIRDKQSVFLRNIPETYKQKQFEDLIIVDDCIGSGDQLRDFWEHAFIDDKKCYLRDFCDTNKISVHYITLFGYDKSIQDLKNELQDLDLCCVRELSDNQRVFLNNSYVWKDEKELQDAIELFKSIKNEYDIPLYGYKKLDFAFIMHQTIPNWSLPLFWKKRNGWELLLRRKNSDG